EPGAQLLEDLPGDGRFALGEDSRDAPPLERADPAEGLGHGEVRHLADVAAVDGDAEGFGTEAPAVADGARALDHELFDLRLDEVALRLAIPPLEVRDEPFEGRLVGVLAAVVPV